MSDDFKESLRKAAGIPTHADMQANEDEVVRLQDEWEQQEPARKSFLRDYQIRVEPLIDSALSGAQEVAKEARHRIDEIIVSPLERNFLSKRIFMLDVSAPISSENLRPTRRIQPNQKGMLDLSLSDKGTLDYQLSAMGKANDAGSVELGSVSKQTIEDVFRGLLSFLY